MRRGRLPQNSFDRLMKKSLHGVRPEESRMQQPGGVSRQGERQTVARVAQSPEEVESALQNAWLALLAEGGRADSLWMTWSVPEGWDEPQVRQVLQQVDAWCEAHDISFFPASLTGGPMFCMTCLLQGQGTTAHVRAQGGQAVAMVGCAGEIGGRKLQRRYEERLAERFSTEWLEKAATPVVTADRLAACIQKLVQAGCLVQTVEEGGVMAALWDLKERTRTGFLLNLLQVPVRQETVEICEYLSVNPYQLEGSGILVVAETAEELTDLLAASEWPWCLLGTLTKEKACRLLKKDEETCLDRPAQDEWWSHCQPKEG